MKMNQSAIIAHDCVISFIFDHDEQIIREIILAPHQSQQYSSRPFHSMHIIITHVCHILIIPRAGACPTHTRAGHTTAPRSVPLQPSSSHQRPHHQPRHPTQTMQHVVACCTCMTQCAHGCWLTYWSRLRPRRTWCTSAALSWTAPPCCSRHVK